MSIEESVLKIASSSRIMNKPLTLEEKKRIILNFIKAMENYFSVEDRKEFKTNKPYKLLEVRLPFCTNFFKEAKPEYSWHPKTKEEMIWYFYHEVMLRINYHIRTKGDERAIDLLLQIHGEQRAIQILEEMMRRNLFVAGIIREKILQLKNKEINKEMIGK